MISYMRRGIGVLTVFWACIPVLPSSYAQTAAPNIVMQRVDGAYLGITMTDVTAENMSRYKLNSERGVIVRSVVKGSPAESAKLQDDDVILEFGGIQVWSSMQLSRLVEETPAGRKVELGISRAGKRMSLAAQLEQRSGRRAEDRPEYFLRGPSGSGARTFRFEVPDVSGINPILPDQGRPRLGITFQALSDQLAEFLGVPGKKGVLISSIADGSPSAGKLKSGDVIIGVDGKSIEKPEDLTRAVRDKTSGALAFKVIRDKKEMSITVNIPADNSRGYRL